MSVEFIPIPFQSILSISDIVNIDISKDKNDFIFAGEQHDFWEFIFVENGEMLITAGENKYILKAGEMAFHLPNEFHAVASYNNRHSTYIVCSFLSTSPYMSYFEHKILSLNGIEKEMLYHALHQSQQTYGTLHAVNHPSGNYYTMDTCVDAPITSSQMIKNYLELLLLSLYQRQENQNIESRTASYAKRLREKKICNSVKDYLETHLDTMLKLDEISYNTGYCISQIQKIFKRETNQSIIDYFIDLKIAKAKQMMRESDDNFTQIAEKLGYSNVNYFSRLFKRKTGITLSEFSRS